MERIFTLPDISFHRLVGFHVVCAGMMQKHQVNVAEIEFAQTLIYGGFGVAILVGVYFRSHKDFFTRHTRFTYSTTHLYLVAVHVCGVNLSEAERNSRLHRVHAHVACKAVCAETHHRHIISAAEADCGSLTIFAL